MGELTTAVTDEKIVNHFTDVLAPFVQQNQCIEVRECISTSPSSSKTKTEAVKEIANMLTASVSGKRSQEVMFCCSCCSFRRKINNNLTVQGCILA